MQRMVDATVAVYDRVVARRPVGRADPAGDGTAILRWECRGRRGHGPRGVRAPAAPGFHAEIVTDLARPRGPRPRVARAPRAGPVLRRPRLGPARRCATRPRARARSRSSCATRPARSSGSCPSRDAAAACPCAARGPGPTTSTWSRREGDAPAVAEVVLDALRRLAPARPPRAPRGGRARCATRSAPAAGAASPTARSQATVAPYLEARGTFETYLGRFRSKQRGNLRRQARAFRADPTGVDPARDRPRARCRRGIDALFALHAKRFEGRGGDTAFAGRARPAVPPRPRRDALRAAATWRSRS